MLSLHDVHEMNVDRAHSVFSVLMLVSRLMDVNMNVIPLEATTGSYFF
jgi:hypothetical protein